MYGVVLTTSGPSLKPKEADSLFLTTTTTDGWISISPMGIGSIHIGRLERRRHLISTRTIEMALLLTSRRSQDWELPAGRRACVLATTTMMDGTICFAPSGVITSSSTTTGTEL